MLEAIDKSFSKLTPADIQAIVTYIRSVKPQSAGAAPGNVPASAPRFSDVGLMNGSAPQGQQLYDSHCSTCHQPDGQGRNDLPALWNNAALHRPVADNAVMAVLQGLTPTQGQAMPAFHSAMNDQQIADLVNYLFKTYGDAGVQTTAERVKQLREGGTPSPLLNLAQGGMVVVGVIIVLLIAGLLFRRRRKQPR